MTSQNPDLSLILEACFFAAIKHDGQIRKDQSGSPYITHPLMVSRDIYQIGGVRDTNILIAAILHDTIEDTGTKPVEILESFGKVVLDIVLEVTDDKSLPKEERKRLQVVHAPEKTYPARIIKWGDKISNCRDILNSPPMDWPLQRRQNYFQWSADVLHKMRGTNASLEAAFDKIVERAEIQLNFCLLPFSSISTRPWAP